MLSQRFLIVTGLATLAALLILWGTPIPLGVPGEWVWERFPLTADVRLAFFLGLIEAVIVLAIVLAVMVIGATRIEAATRREAAGWLYGLLAVGGCWLFSVQACAPGDFPFWKPNWVLYSPASSGYFFEAATKIDDTGEFLESYEERMAEGEVLHVGTHPPGLFLLHRGLIVLCRDLPALADVVLASQPPEIAEAFGVLEQAAGLAAPLPRSDRAALWLAVLMTHLAAAATVIPLYRLLRFDHSRVTAWQVCCLWPFIPALAIFLPKSDALLPLIGTTLIWASVAAYRLGSCWRAGLAGFFLWCGMMTSLAVLPVLLVVILWAAWQTIRPRIAANRSESEPTGTDAGTQDSTNVAVISLRELLQLVGIGAASFLAATVLFSLWTDCHLGRVWWWNYHNHGGFYEQYPRTYWKWLLVNPWELTWAAGVPVVAVAIRGGMRLLADGGLRAAVAHPLSGRFLACLTVWILLWISGKNMGEAARLWLFLMPWLLWMGSVAFDPAGEPPSVPRRRKDRLDPAPAGHRAWQLLLILQAVACVATVTRINGFSLP